MATPVIVDIECQQQFMFPRRDAYLRVHVVRSVTKCSGLLDASGRTATLPTVDAHAPAAGRRYRRTHVFLEARDCRAVRVPVDRGDAPFELARGFYRIAATRVRKVQSFLCRLRHACGRADAVATHQASRRRKQPAGPARPAGKTRQSGRAAAYLIVAKSRLRPSARSGWARIASRTAV